MTHPEAATEVVITKTESRPTCVRFGRWRKWRWQVTLYSTAESETHAGVWTRREHMSGFMDYAFTRRGAGAAASKYVARVNEPVQRYLDRHFPDWKKPDRCQNLFQYRLERAGITETTDWETPQ